MIKSKLIAISLLLSAGVCFAQENEPNNFEDWSSKPKRVTPAEKNLPPSDAVVLFSDNLSLWSTEDGSEVSWKASCNGFSIIPGTPSIKTRQSFGSCQLHVEWRIPENEDHGESLDWGNSGVFLMSLYEVQIYDSYNDEHKIYYNGQAGSIYKQHKPLVNSSKKTGQWESFDIVFTAPEFHGDGTVKSPAYFTVFQNGVLIQNHVEVKGGTNHSKYTAYEKHGTKLPLLIQSHGSAVSYRNIWIREL